MGPEEGSSRVASSPPSFFSSSLLFPALLPRPSKASAPTSSSPPAHPFDALRPATREDLFAFLSSLSPAADEKHAVLSSLASFASSCSSCANRCNQRLDAYRSFLSSLDSSSPVSPSTSPRSPEAPLEGRRAAAIAEEVEEQVDAWRRRCLTACARELTSQLPSSP
ncbi:hypothetical protein TGPRC2_249325 [Toxoplasma gondii TgCatPRC2]|uniref:Uncharacterized protein n=14 Tax=Toxoplasma gondii TaxID=5811 RepID=A0A125YK11_TOXGV|nr:hypothetical protein TGME49_249325 [Toxoplasma gondii ME49]EPR63456.1 hypothetical protein TGGT1_249325 [Toxoplasma gondii GT1]ESS34430.1 hypothetical protein TGVEG_249325 [Toxoplasma gondii VEG]KAF4638698.1 hypothetical protein TGRH88_063070 [Toxoplasma gondii]KFG46343.1 hypothetical protein TGDOM2_249325 [Toxoplasma gondii GAB2-2007-GAL-DOM2]KFG48732.1 hypothetical protein TGP89_249325 [Toxoplasma gondii p89]KFG54202.1 hypothetical protein TGFOU_249325 [Toxoplasma gondii FOU]KFG64309.1 |eukprot:XP_018635029.1 hypothetical protein TGME49_249325 [Toxoplasma gondii ME49]